LHLSMDDMHPWAEFETAGVGDMRGSSRQAFMANRIFLHENNSQHARVRVLKDRWGNVPRMLNGTQPVEENSDER